ncbi:MAG: tRNA pseudouridine(55) synthase TruB [Rickettsiales bacterium]|nr:tRNA pseudouridine(55) synthase TruB [Rickettsiales bacterium]
MKQVRHPKFPLHGWINLDKPYNMTSTQAVGAVKRILRPEKIGHAGTLDPLATGILPLALGEATKTVPYVVDSTKEYVFTVRWGARTTTDDTEGEVIATSATRPSPEAIIAALPAFIGVVSQIPPAFSAIKLQGARAYDLARAGQEVNIAPRDVHIDHFSLKQCVDEDHAEFHVECGKGTYVRSLARDIALILGTQGHVSQLRRTRVGKFSETSAISLEKLEALVHNAPPSSGEGLSFLLPPADGLDDIPALRVDQEMATILRNGQPVLASAAFFESEDATLYKAMYGRELVALTERQGRKFSPVRVFRC